MHPREIRKRYLRANRKIFFRQDSVYRKLYEHQSSPHGPHLELDNNPYRSHRPYVVISTSLERFLFSSIQESRLLEQSHLWKRKPRFNSGGKLPLSGPRFI